MNKKVNEELLHKKSILNNLAKGTKITTQNDGVVEFIKCNRTRFEAIYNNEEYTFSIIDFMGVVGEPNIIVNNDTVKTPKKESYKNQITKKINELNLSLKLGCYDKNINKIPVNEFNQILENITGDSTDIYLTINKELYIVEIEVVDNEIDFNIINGVEYFNKYGEMRLDEALENEDITQEQYDYIENRI